MCHDTLWHIAVCSKFLGTSGSDLGDVIFMNATFRKQLSILFLFVLMVLGRIVYMTPDYREGEKAPDFGGVLVDGGDFSLSQLKGNYVLVHFWGSWCGPCRQENPQLVRFWLENRNKEFSDAEGFSIVSIAIETDRTSPVRAISKDGLLWENHLIDVGDSLRFFDAPISNLWGVHQVPSTFLLDPNHKIIGYNLTHNEMQSVLNSASH